MALQGKAAIITGVSGAGQVGQAVAEAFAAAGARLIVAARSADQVSQRARELRERGAEVHAVAADLSTEAGAAQLAVAARERLGRLDALVHLAGGLRVWKPALEHTAADWDREMQNNLLSAFLTVRACFPLLRDSGGGAIILFSRAGQAQANMLAYNCAKAGVDALTRTFALEGRDLGIRVNAIAPGLTDTAMNIDSMKPKDTSRWARRADIAAAAVFLASDGAAGITAQVIPVTGKGV